MTMLSGKVCVCKHTHVYEGKQYLDCPYCICHMHSDDTIDTMAVYNQKRFNAWVNKHVKRPKRIKQESINDQEIQRLIELLA